MTIKRFLEKSVKQLEAAGIGSARLDCLILLEDATGKDRSWLLAHPEFTVQGSTLYRLGRQVERRVRHEPLAYVRGKTEFYGREFMVNKHVLEPRPESETMIELALKMIGDRLEVLGQPLRVIDVGTGSGALAVTIKLEVPKTEVFAIDIDSKCLKVAKQNARKLGADVTFLQGNLLEPAYKLEPITYSLLCNLPYVPDNYKINKAASIEPRHAIFGGPDGMDIYRQLFDQIAKLEHKPDYVFTEALPLHHNRLAAIAGSTNYKQIESKDFIQVFVSREREAA